MKGYRLAYIVIEDGQQTTRMRLVRCPVEEFALCLLAALALYRPPPGARGYLEMYESVDGNAPSKAPVRVEFPPMMVQQ